VPAVLFTYSRLEQPSSIKGHLFTTSTFSKERKLVFRRKIPSKADFLLAVFSVDDHHPASPATDRLMKGMFAGNQRVKVPQNAEV